MYQNNIFSQYISWVIHGKSRVEPVSQIKIKEEEMQSLDLSLKSVEVVGHLLLTMLTVSHLANAANKVI